MSVDHPTPYQDIHDDLSHQAAGRAPKAMSHAPHVIRRINRIAPAKHKIAEHGTRIAAKSTLPPLAISPARQMIRSALLDATIPPACSGSSPLKPLWVDEAMQRAYNIVRLTRELEHKAPLLEDGSNRPQTEYEMAIDLAESFWSLAKADDSDMQPCFDPLRSVVLNLVALFGPAFGKVSLDISVERLTLPAHKRRALVLVACELVLNALCHGLSGRSAGNIAVHLSRTARTVAQLSVADDGCGIAQGAFPLQRSIASDLAAVLETDITYLAREGGGTVARLSFPVPALN
ncbi:MAG TPA: hypothetical protein PLY97_08480 [Acidocella sp.]|nr:hypothetical protein [Acidocella sp.]